MQMRMNSGHCDRYTVEHQVFPRTDSGKRFGTLLVAGTRTGDPHPADVCVFVDRAADLDEIIEHAIALRSELAEAERVESEAKQAEEVALAEEAERQMEPHAEDAHADSAPHG